MTVAMEIETVIKAFTKWNWANQVTVGTISFTIMIVMTLPMAEEQDLTKSSL